jgi:hypothetical protein
MRPLTTAELLLVWETGLQQSPLERSLHLLGKACAIADVNEVASMSIGERDARLLQLRGWVFGRQLLNVAHCPRCNERVEWESRIDELQLQPLPEQTPRQLQLELEGYRVRFRLPDSHDMHRLLHDPFLRAQPRQILLSCILETWLEQQPLAADGLPSHILDAVQQRMSEEDPQADISLLLDCPACRHQWEALFDISSYLWAEIHQWALRLLQEIGLLAKTFHWSEQDILNMSARRRQFYLEMAGA